MATGVTSAEHRRTAKWHMVLTSLAIIACVWAALSRQMQGHGTSIHQAALTQGSIRELNTPTDHKHESVAPGDATNSAPDTGVHDATAEPRTIQSDLTSRTIIDHDHATRSVQSEVLNSRSPTEYRVSVSQTATGLAIVLDRDQLWETNMYRALRDSSLTLATRDGKVVGVTFQHVENGELLAAIGFKPGDTVKMVNGQPLNNPLTIPAVVIRGIGGQRASLVVERAGTEITLDITSTGVPKATNENLDRFVEYHDLAAAATVLRDTIEALPKGPDRDSSSVKEARSQIAAMAQATGTADPLLKSLISDAATLVIDAPERGYQ